MSSSVLKTHLVASLPRSRAAVTKDIAGVEDVVSRSEQLLSGLDAQRQSALHRGDDPAVDVLDGDIADARKVLCRSRERLTFFRQEFEQADLAEKAELERASRLRAEATSASAVKRFGKIDGYIGLLSAELRLLAAEQFIVHFFNVGHSDSPVAVPNSVRHESRKIIPARSVEVTVGGQYNAHFEGPTGRVEIRGEKEQVVTREIPAEIIPGYEPEDLCETVFLPEVFAGGPSWGDANRLKNWFCGRYSRPRIESIEDALAIIAAAEKKS